MTLKIESSDKTNTAKAELLSVSKLYGDTITMFSSWHVSQYIHQKRNMWYYPTFVLRCGKMYAMSMTNEYIEILYG